MLVVGVLAAKLALATRWGLLADEALYWVWADLLTVFTYLENVTLYEYSSGTGDNAALVPISLMDVIGALIMSTRANAHASLF